MDTIGRLTEVLQSDGGWALAAVFAAVIWRLVVYIRDQHKERILEQAGTIRLLEGVKNSLTGTEKAFDRNEKAFNRFTEKLDHLLVERRL